MKNAQFFCDFLTKTGAKMVRQSAHVEMRGISLTSKSGFIQGMKPKNRLFSCDFSRETPFDPCAQYGERFLCRFSLRKGDVKKLVNRVILHPPSTFSRRETAPFLLIYAGFSYVFRQKPKKIAQNRRNPARRFCEAVKKSDFFTASFRRGNRRRKIRRNACKGSNRASRKQTQKSLANTRTRIVRYCLKPHKNRFT